MTPQSINAYKTATHNFLKQLEVFNEQQFNTVPFEGSWTPGQIADHMYKSQVGLPQVLTGSTEPANRAADANNAVIGNIFLDFNTRLNSPDFILPSQQPLNKAEMLRNYYSKADEIEQTAQPLDGAEVCLDFKFPVMGTLTRTEWLHFVTCHTIRHTRQLENIHQQMNG